MRPAETLLAPTLLLLLAMSGAGCFPHSATATETTAAMKKADAAYDSGQKEEATKLYEGLLGSHLIVTDYDHAIQRLGKLFLEKAKEAQESAEEGENPLGAIAALIEIRKGAHKLNLASTEDALNQAMVRQANRGWKQVIDHESAGRPAAALWLAQRLLAGLDPVPKELESRFARVQQGVVALHSKTAEEALVAGHVARAALHEGLARWAGATTTTASDKLRAKFTLGLTPLAAGSSCLDKAQALRKGLLGVGSIPVEVRLEVKDCEADTESEKSEEEVTWTETETYTTTEDIYKTVYKGSDQCIDHGDGKGGYVYKDCGRLTESREYIGQREVTKTRQVTKTAMREVERVTHNYTINLTMKATWADGSIEFPISRTDSISDVRYGAPDAKRLPAHHSQENLEARIHSDVENEIRGIARGAAYAAIASKVLPTLEFARNAGDEALVEDIEAQLLFLDSATGKEIENRLGLTQGAAALALQGEAPAAPEAVDYGTIEEYKRIAPTIGTNLLGNPDLYVERGVTLRYLMAYRNVSVADVPVQEDRSAHAFSMIGSWFPSDFLKESRNKGPIRFEVDWTAYIGKRSSPAQVYPNGDEESALAYGLGAGSVLHLGTGGDRFGIFVGARWGYMWHAIGDLRVAAHTIPLNVRAELGFWPRYPVILNAWGYDLLNGREQYGGDLSIGAGGQFSWVARVERTDQDGRFGGLMSSDVVDAGRLNTTTLDLGFHYGF